MSWYIWSHFISLLCLILFHFSYKAELSTRNGEHSQEKIPIQTVVVLKSELAQKTEALNKALKRENELKVCEQEAAFHIWCWDCIIKYLFKSLIFHFQISLAEIQSLLAELDGRREGQAANIDSLTAMLKTKDEIITVRSST